MSRLSSVNRFLEFLFYFVTAGLFILAVYNDHLIFTEDMLQKAGLLQTRFGGRFKFLTFLNLNGQTFYFSLCFLRILIEVILDKPNKKTKHTNSLRKFTNFFWSSIALPYGVFVGLSFWGIYLVNRELIFPQRLDAFIPTYHNHMVHTMPFVFVVVENFIVEHKHHPSFIKGVIPTILCGAAYLIWVLVIAVYAGFWVYPVLRVLSTFYRTLFIVSMLFLMSMCYIFGKLINDMLWSSKNERKELNTANLKRPNLIRKLQDKKEKKQL